MDDPLILAVELARHVPSATASGVGGTASGVSVIRTGVKLYKARTALTPALRLHRVTEESTMRLMDRSKCVECSVGLLSRIICKGGGVDFWASFTGRDLGACPRDWNNLGGHIQ